MTEARSMMKCYYVIVVLVYVLICQPGLLSSRTVQNT